jgi:hypothetical protein
MCLEAVGGKDDKDCNGKGVGAPCQLDDKDGDKDDSTSENAICAHDASRGGWECLTPKEELMPFAVCQGQDAGTPCSFKGAEKGLVQGACQEHDDDHGGMMCLDSNEGSFGASGAPMTTAVSTIWVTLGFSSLCFWLDFTS